MAEKKITIRAKYRRQGDLFYKIKGFSLIEVNMEHFDSEMASVSVGCASLFNPNKYTLTIKKADFDEAYKAAMQLIKAL